jgi:hypothetical protein
VRPANAMPSLPFVVNHLLLHALCSPRQQAPCWLSNGQHGLILLPYAVRQ